MARIAMLLLGGWLCASSFLAPQAEAMMVAQLELTGGAMNAGWRYERQLDRLLSQTGTLTVGQYQAMGEIVPSLTKGRQTFSLFTSGLNGAPAPTVTIAGSSITADLSSLFFAKGRGGEQHIFNIGGLATGVFSPETRAFTLSWQHLFDHEWEDRRATFFLKGVVVEGPQPVAIPASLLLYATGFFGLGSWAWSRRLTGQS